MVFSSPLILDQKVALQDRLYNEVVFFVPLLKQSLLHDCQLGLIYANEAAFCFSNGHLLAYLKVSVKEDLLAKSPANIDSANQVLSLLRHLCELVHFLVAVIRILRLAI